MFEVYLKGTLDGKEGVYQFGFFAKAERAQRYATHLYNDRLRSGEPVEEVYITDDAGAYTFRIRHLVRDREAEENDD